MQIASCQCFEAKNPSHLARMLLDKEAMHSAGERGCLVALNQLSLWQPQLLQQYKCLLMDKTKTASAVACFPE
jgi:hypothetical protein